MGKTPKLRFEGFDGEWEEKKVREIVGETYGGGTPKTSVDEYWSGNIPWIQSSNVSENELFTINIQKHISKIGLQKSATQLVPAKSIAVVSHVGVGKLVFMPFEYTTSQDFISLSNLKADPVYTCYALYKRLQKDLHIVQGSAIKGITKDTLLDKKLFVPNMSEQTIIGSTLRNLDTLITLQQRKCDALAKAKKYYLQQMFPQKGEKRPRLRFEGFEGDWEEKKLGDVIVEMYNGQTPSRNKEEYWKGTINWLSSGELNRGKVYSSVETITEEGKRAANLRIVPKGTFVIAITGLEAAGTRGNCAILEFETCLNQSCMALFPKKDELSVDFLFQWYKLVGEEYGIRYTQGTKQQSYNAEIIADLNIILPGIEEQGIISKTLEKLDTLITLQQRKLAALKTMKQFMLQNMFPNGED